MIKTILKILIYVLGILFFAVPFAIGMMITGLIFWAKIGLLGVIVGFIIYLIVAGYWLYEEGVIWAPKK